MTRAEHAELREALAAELHKQWQLSVQRLVQLGVDLVGQDPTLIKALYKDFECLTGVGPYQSFARTNANAILELLVRKKAIEVV